MYEIPVFSAKYSRLQDDGDEDETYESLKKPQRTSSTKRFSIIHQVILVSLLCLILSAVTGTLFYRFVGANFRSIKAENRLCEQISFRREWRSLSQSEKHDYLSSVKCLHERPSRLDLNQSLYDDFAWVHYRIGGIGEQRAYILAALTLSQRMKQPLSSHGIAISFIQFIVSCKKNVTIPER